MAKRRKEFADESSGRKRKGRKPARVAGTVDGTAEITVEGRDYAFRADKLEEWAAQIAGGYKALLKRLKLTVAKLATERHKAVTEGGEKGQQGILFPSMEASRLQAEQATLKHLEMGLIVANRLEDVPLADLARVEQGISRVLDSSCVEESQPDGKTAASGESDTKQAAGG